MCLSMIYFSATEWNKLLTNTKTWMSLKIIGNKNSQEQNSAYEIQINLMWPKAGQKLLSPRMEGEMHCKKTWETCECSSEVWRRVWRKCTESWSLRWLRRFIILSYVIGLSSWNGWSLLYLNYSSIIRNQCDKVN